MVRQRSAHAVAQATTVGIPCSSPWRNIPKKLSSWSRQNSAVSFRSFRRWTIFSESASIFGLSPPSSADWESPSMQFASARAISASIVSRFDWSGSCSKKNQFCKPLKSWFGKSCICLQRVKGEFEVACWDRGYISFPYNHAKPVGPRFVHVHGAAAILTRANAVDHVLTIYKVIALLTPSWGRSRSRLSGHSSIGLGIKIDFSLAKRHIPRGLPRSQG